MKAKVDAMFTLLTQTYEYQNIIERFKELEKVDEVAATHSSDRYTHNITQHKKDIKEITEKIRTNAKIAHESCELAAAHIITLTYNIAFPNSATSTYTTVASL